MKKTFICLFLLLPALGQCAKSQTEISEAFGDAIVSVNVARKDGSTHSGTGFIVNPSGVIATAGHVTEGAIFINVTFKNGAISDEAVVLDVSSSKEIDIALLKISNNNLPHVIFKNSDYVRAGEDITVIGNPRRLQNTITNGLISQLRQVSKGVIWQQISAPISPSSSGSPVFNANGFVIGIALSSLRGSDNQNLNFAIPSNYLMQLMVENNITPDMESKRYENKTQGQLRTQPLIEKIRNHVKKSWYILKVRILGLED